MSYTPPNPNGQATMANSSPVVIASNQSAVPVSGTVTANIGTTNGLALDATLTGGTQKTKLVDTGGTNVASIDSSGALAIQSGGTTGSAVPTRAVQVAGSDGTNLRALKVDSTGVLSVSQASGSATGLAPQTSGGLSTFHLVSAGSTNATNIKASAGQLYGWFIYNSNSSARKVAFHNTAGTPTAGASIFFSIVIPPSSGANVEYTNGVTFSTGIAITTVTGLADSDANAVAANDLIINIFYK